MECAIHSICEQYPNQYQFSVQSCCSDIFHFHPNVTRLMQKPDRIIEMHYPTIHKCSQWDVRYLSGYVEYLGEQLNLKLRTSCNRPHIYFSQDELSRAKQVTGEYAVICSSFKDDYQTKNWGFDNWQAVVDWVIKEKGIKVVQVGEQHHNCKLLKGAVNLIGRTNIRQLFLLAKYAKFGLGHESFLHHVFAAVNDGTPFVCVSSGWNPSKWASYPGPETYITKQGSLTCCKAKGCFKARFAPRNKDDKSVCERPTKVGLETVGECMKMVSVDEVTRAIQDFYTGGVCT